MTEVSTPVNNAYLNTTPANLINDLDLDEDHQFSSRIRAELQKIVFEPDPAVTESLLIISRLARPL